MGLGLWYRHRSWNAEKAADFEARLKKAPAAFQRANYLAIQGNFLVSSADPESRAAGVALAKRVIAEYPEEKWYLSIAYETLGDFHLGNQNYVEAEKAYREVPRVADQMGLRGIGIWQEKLAKAVLFSRQAEKYGEAKQLLQAAMTRARKPKSYLSRFECFVTLARLSRALGESGKASRYARKALRLVGLEDPELLYNATVKADQGTLNELRALAEARRTWIFRLLRLTK